MPIPFGPPEPVYPTWGTSLGQGIQQGVQNYDTNRERHQQTQMLQMQMLQYQQKLAEMANTNLEQNLAFQTKTGTPYTMQDLAPAFAQLSGRGQGQVDTARMVEADRILQASAGKIDADLEYKQDRLAESESRNAERASRADEREYKRKERRSAERERYVNKFNSDPSVKRAQQMIDGAGTVEALLSAENPVADGSVPTFMARASGEVGALSEADKAPFGGSRAIIERLKQAAEEAVSGKLSENNRAFVAGLADVMRKRGRASIGELASHRSKQWARASDFLDEKDIYATLAPEDDGPAGIRAIALSGAKAKRLEELRQKKAAGGLK